jgi:3',5'-cyclic AMP phosphodiesterase CpdA
MIRLILDSDLHFADGAIKPNKSDHLEKIIGYVGENNVDAMICAGDLTDVGTDGRGIACWKYGGEDDQLTPLKKFVAAIEQHIPVYLCTGNHDRYSPYNWLHSGILKYVKNKHGSLLYNWAIGEYRFISLDLYPDAKALRYLARVFAQYPTDQYIIYFHYNIEGAFSDWWDDKSKDAFFAAITGKRVRMIVTGHRHENYHISYNNVDVVSAAAGIIVCEIDATGVTTISL